MKSLLLYVAIKIVSVTSNYNHVDPSNHQTEEASNFKELHKNIDLKNYDNFDETNIPIEKIILNNNNFDPKNEGTRLIRYTIKKIPLGEDNIVTDYNNDAGLKKYVLNNPNEVHTDGYNGEQINVNTTYFWPDSQFVSDNHQVIPLALDRERNIDISKMQTLSEKNDNKDTISRPLQAKYRGTNEEMKNLFKLAEIREVHEPGPYTENKLLSDLKTGPDRSQENKNVSVITYLVNLNGQGRNKSKIYEDYIIHNQRKLESYPWYKVLFDSKPNQQYLKGNHEDINILRDVSHGQPTGYLTPYEMEELSQSRSKIKNDLGYKLDLQQEKKNNSKTDMQNLFEKKENKNQNTSIPTAVKHWGANENIQNILKVAEIHTTQEHDPAFYAKTELPSNLKTAPDRSQEIMNTHTTGNRFSWEYPWNKANQQNLKENHKDINILQREVSHEQPKGYLTPYEMAKLYESMSKIKNGPEYKIELQRHEYNDNPNNTKRDKVDTQSLQNIQSYLQLSNQAPAKELIPQEKEKIHKSQLQLRINPESDLQHEKRNQIISHDNRNIKKIYETDSLRQSNDIIKLKSINESVQFDPKIPLEHHDEDEHEHTLNKNFYKQYLKIYLNQVFSKVSFTIEYIQKLLNLDIPNIIYKILQEYAQLSISMFDVLAEIDKYYSLINQRSHRDFLTTLKTKVINDYNHDNDIKATENLVNLIKKYESVNLDVKRDPKHIFDVNTDNTRHDEREIHSAPNVNSILQLFNKPSSSELTPKMKKGAESNVQLKEQNIPITHDNSKPNEFNYKTTLEHRDEDEQKLNRIAYKKYLKIYLNQLFTKVSLTIDFIQKLLSHDALHLYEILKEYAQMSITMFNALQKMDTYYSLINHRSTQDFLVILRNNINEDDQLNNGNKTAENIVNLTKKYNTQIPKEEKSLEYVLYLQPENKKSPLLNKNNANTYHSKRDDDDNKRQPNLESDFELGNQPQPSEIMPYVVELETVKPEVKKDPKFNVQLKDQADVLSLDTIDIKKMYGSNNRTQSNNKLILKPNYEKWKDSPIYKKSTEFNDKIPLAQSVKDVMHKLNKTKIIENIQKPIDNNSYSIDNIENVFHDKMSNLNNLYHKMYLNKELINVKRRIELMLKLLSLDELNLYDILKEYAQIPTTMVDFLTEINKHHRLKNHIANRDLISLLMSNIIKDYILDNDDIYTNNMYKYIKRDISNVFLFNLIKDNSERNVLSPNCNREEAADLIRRFALDLANQLSSIGCSRGSTRSL